MTQKQMTDERLVEIALGGTATKEESEEMAMMLLNWHKGPKEETTEDAQDKVDVN